MPISFPAAHQRTLPIRLRPDLRATAVTFAGSPTWVIKDPLTLEHFHFTAEEHALLEMLALPRSLDELQSAFERRFAPRRTSVAAISDFIARLHRSGLLLATGAGQGNTLVEQRQSEQRQSWKMAWTQILAIRFRGINPDAGLSWIYARIRWVFSLWMLPIVLAVVGYAGLLLVGGYQEFTTRLPELNALLDLRNVGWLMAAICLVKILHELGHALFCKHFGGEVQELGLLLLAFTPCLYCDVSDAWQLASKRQRILISAGGILVEFVLAALALIVWWHTVPGVLNLVALNIVVVASISTLIVNGNPLLRYDGYYILADLVESPNLWQRSRDVLGELGERWLLGLRSVGDALTPARHRGWLAAYAVASKLYLCLVLVGIVWMMVQLLHPLHLERLAYGLGCVVAGSALVGPTSGIARMLRNPTRRRELRTGRITLLVLLAVAAGVVVLRLPVEYRVKAPVVVMPTDSCRVYATVAGTLRETIAPGSTVAQGDVIAKLENLEIAREIARLEGEHRLALLRQSQFEMMRLPDSSASHEIPAAAAVVEALATQLDDRRRDALRLTLVAPASGVVLPVTHQPRAGNRSATQLATWEGSLLDRFNQGAHVEAGSLVALVTDPTQMEAELIVDDADIERVQPAQTVRLVFHQQPGRVYLGRVVEIARHDERHAADGHSTEAGLARLRAGLTPPGQTGMQYRVRVALADPDLPLTAGARGRAKIATGRLTLARHLIRFLAHTFRVPLD